MIDEKALEAAVRVWIDAEPGPDAQSERNAMRAAILAYESAKQKGEAEGWRPIESAPKDGTSILIGFAAEGEKPGAAFDGWWDREAGGWVDGDTDNYDDLRVYHHITHWRPLPEPPTMLSAGGEG